MRKQGMADRSNSAGVMTQPVAYAKSPKGVSQIGTNLGNHITGRARILTDVPQPVHAGRGYNPPGPVGKTIRKSGSQGSH